MVCMATTAPTVTTSAAAIATQRMLNHDRVEAGQPRYMHEFDNDSMPAEAGVVDRAVSFTKGCYPGQEPVARLFYRGHVNRGVRGLRLAGPVDPGAEVTHEGKPVGRSRRPSIRPGSGTSRSPSCGARWRTEPCSAPVEWRLWPSLCRSHTRKHFAVVVAAVCAGAVHSSEVFEISRDSETLLSDASLMVGLGQLDEAEETLVLVLRRADAAEDDDLASRAYEGLATIATRRGRETRARELFERAVERGGEPDPADRPWLYLELGRVLSSVGEPQQAADLLQWAVDRLGESGDIAIVARFTTFLSYALADFGEYGRANAVLSELLRDRAEEIDDITSQRVNYALDAAEPQHRENRPGDRLRRAHRRRRARLRRCNGDLQQLPAGRGHAARRRQHHPCPGAAGLRARGDRRPLPVRRRHGHFC